MDDSEKAAAYLILCLKNHKIYVGSSIHPRKRWQQHQILLRRGAHNNKGLQSSFDDFGIESPVFAVVTAVDAIDLPQAEHELWERVRSILEPELLLNEVKPPSKRETHPCPFCGFPLNSKSFVKFSLYWGGCQRCRPKKGKDRT